MTEWIHPSPTQPEAAGRTNLRSTPLDRVLLVDDSRVTRMLVDRILQPYSHEVLCVDGYAPAMEAVSRGPAFDLVISDVYMREGDGFDLVRALGALPAPPAVLLMTGREISGDERARAAELGAIDWLEKPVSARDILAAWRRATTRVDARHPGTPLLRMRAAGDDAEPLALTDRAWLEADQVFVPTEGALPLGMEVTIELAWETSRVDTMGTVSAVLEPDWTHPGGVVVAFDPLSRSRLEAVLHPSSRNAR